MAISCFDVGANVGVYTEVFAALGARVVAVEPNPRCARILEMLSQRLPVQVERCAISDRAGRQKLQVSEVHLLSALAENEEDASQRSPLHREVKWLGAIEVEVKTLAQLAATHGVPNFVKIDAEGVDDRVIAGMDFAPDTLSFEYYKHLPDVARRCMEAPIFSRGYEFNYVHGFGMKLAWENWLDLAALRARLESLAQTGEDYGDVVARRKTGSNSNGNAR